MSYERNIEQSKKDGVVDKIAEIEKRFKELGVNRKFSLLIIDERTQESSRKNDYLTMEEVDRFMKSFKPGELDHFTIIGFSNVIVASAELAEFNSIILNVPKGKNVSNVGKRKTITK